LSPSEMENKTNQITSCWIATSKKQCGFTKKKKCYIKTAKIWCL